MNDSSKIGTHLLVRNSIFSLLGQLAPLVMAIFTIPFIIRGLGIDRFGILSLVWVVLGYLSLFDLGLGRATTKFVAEALGRNEKQELPRLVWMAVAIQGIFGTTLAIALYLAAPVLVSSVFKIPPSLISESQFVFRLIAVSIPVVMVSSSFSGVLEASQRFDLTNLVKIPMSVFVYILPLAGIMMGFQLAGIVVLILASRCITLIVLVIMCIRLHPELRNFSFSADIIPRIFSFGIWITFSNIIVPVIPMEWKPRRMPRYRV